MNSLTLEPIFGSVWPALAVMVFGGFLLFSVRPATGQVSTWRQKVLLTVRGTALLLLVLSLLRPSFVRTDSRPTSASLVVLADASRSMTLTDGEGGNRWESQAQFLKRLAPALEKLGDDLEISIYQYGKDASLISFDQLDDFLASAPEQRRTDLAEALRAALSGASGRPLSGVVMIGDGTSTVDESNPAVVARTLSSLEVPLWTVPIGPQAGDSQARDVAVEQLPESYRVFSKNLFRVEAMIESRGMVGRDLPVTVSLVDTENRRSELARRVFVPSNPSESIVLDVELVAPKPGSYRLEVEAEAQQGESLTDNNQQVAFLDVREGGGRIYYLEGRPRIEQLFLRRALTESPDLEVTLQIAPETKSNWPIDMGRAFAPGQYDVYVIGDVPAAAIGNDNLRELADVVERGAGLMMIGGEQAFDAGGYYNSPLANVLPIATTAANSGRRSNPASSMIDSPVSLRVRKPHPITRFGTGSESNKIWQELKPLQGANQFLGVKADPTVEVLLESAEGQPMLVIGGYGAGRVSAFAGDTTWRWWRQGKDEIHRRFWRQMILWLLSRDAPEQDSVWVRLESRRFLRENPSAFYAGVESVEESANEYELKAEVIAADGTATQVPLAAEPQTGPNGSDAPLVGGVIPDLPGGVYRLRVSPKSKENLDAGVAPAEVLFQIVDLDVELSRPLAEVSRLQQLSALTADAGGRAFRPDEVEQLISTINALRNRARLPVVEKYRLGEGPFSGWLLMCSFTALLCGEWFLRKVWGLA